MLPVGFARVLFVACAASVLAAQSQLFRLVGSPASGFGAAVLGPGDLDLDGFVDVLVSEPGAGSGAGVVHVYSGRDGALRQSLLDAGSRALGTRLGAAGDLDRDGHPDFWVGSEVHLTAWSGRTLALLHRAPAAPIWDGGGDVDGDRVPDLLLGVGAPYNELWLLSGRDLTLFARLPVPGLRSARWAGDVDRDGRTDLLVGAVDSTTGREGISLLAAGNGRVLRVHQADSFGRPITAGPAGDVDQDGAADYYLYETTRSYPPSTTGYVTLIAGGTGAELGTFSGSVICAHTSCSTSEFLAEPRGFAALDGTGSLAALLPRTSMFGAGTTTTVDTRTYREVLAIAGTAVPLGDVDRDGTSDVAAIDPAAGTVTVLALHPFQKVGENVVHTEAPPFSTYGRVFGLGDLNRDGTPDLAFAAPKWTYGSGSFVECSVLSGADFSTLFRLGGRTLSGTVPSVQVADAGDLDGDGRPDVVFGCANDAGTPQPEQGGAYSATGTLLFAFSNPDWSYGMSVCGGIDWNLDGRSDVVISATTFAHVLSGRDQSVLFTWNRGGNLTRVGDLDRDGRPDLAFGDTVLASGSAALLGTRAGTMAWADAGDVDGDRVPDLWSATSAGLECISGRTWATVRSVAWPFATPSPTLSTGDWNGDAVADLAVGSGAENVALVLSGRDGSVLFRYRGRGADRFGESVALAIHAEPGKSRLAAAAPRGGRYGFGYAFLLADPPFPPGASPFGVPCGRAGEEPALHWIGGAPRLGANCALRVTAHASGVALTWVGSEREWNGTPLPAGLAAAGLPACVLRASPIALAIAAMTPPALSLPITIPQDVRLLGAGLGFQAGILPAVPVQPAVSNALRARVGQ